MSISKDLVSSGGWPQFSAPLALASLCPSLGGWSAGAATRCWQCSTASWTDGNIRSGVTTPSMKLSFPRSSSKVPVNQQGKVNTFFFPVRFQPVNAVTSALGFNPPFNCT
ncbi:hypothetical protein AAFF_G00165470 [Aldrovandia affinis]|uniref:Uncharacterized protein n=1 Tax=Aldrovandia affinis TaxID=143900 RepID=A0AAD7RMT3_9TELE|nr:hypothetical protein AAFF_G00165470 [Aldrovandia affinis]